jgi:hypothetical protein
MHPPHGAQIKNPAQVTALAQLTCVMTADNGIHVNITTADAVPVGRVRDIINAFVGRVQQDLIPKVIEQEQKAAGIEIAPANLLGAVPPPTKH